MLGKETKTKYMFLHINHNITASLFSLLRHGTVPLPFFFSFFWSFMILMFQWRNVLNVENKPVEELGENTFLSSFGSMGKTFASKTLKKCQT